jgi:hypothetical protein
LYSHCELVVRGNGSYKFEGCVDELEKDLLCASTFPIMASSFVDDIMESHESAGLEIVGYFRGTRYTQYHLGHTTEVVRRGIDLLLGESCHVLKSVVEDLRIQSSIPKKKLNGSLVFVFVFYGSDQTVTRQ